MSSSYADLEQKAAWVRHQVFEMYVAAKRGHLVSSLSLTEILITLYYGEELLLKEIGEVLGVTESRVSQIHSRALYRLNRELVSLTGRT